MRNEESFKHEILTATMIVTDKGVLALSTDNNSIKSILDTIKQHNIKYKAIQLTTNKDRLNTLGNHTIRKPCPSSESPLVFRNKVIREWQDYKDTLAYKIRVDDEATWNKISKKYGITCSCAEFNEWMLDLEEFTFKNVKA